MAYNSVAGTLAVLITMDHERLKPVRIAEVAVNPITIGPRNAVEMTGLSWRWLRDNAERLGVALWRVGGKSMIPAAPLLEALAREAEQRKPYELTDEEERQRLRYGLGMERIPRRSSVG
jgi:hypothetical protein